ncbi:MAG: Fpg/Nei family DNA glycosylase [Planctomycetota bacterium]|jgi:formamidopyrimidine-DNA glycosylase
MPELPEVERGRRLAQRVATGRRIERVHCATDDIVLANVTPARMRLALRGRRVLDVGRRGKHLWFELDQRPWPTFHFGMTGAFVTPGEEPLQLASSPDRPQESWPPRFAKIRLVFDDGGELAMTNKRRLGRIRLHTDPLGEPPIRDLGFDPLLDLPTPARFVELLHRRSAIMKALLLDQSFAAGVGNWIADEILYQARIDPRRTADSLTATEARRVRQKLKLVVETAVGVNAAKDRFPRSWLFHRRWGRDPQAVTGRGERITHITIAGRSTAWVPDVQR